MNRNQKLIFILIIAIALASFLYSCSTSQSPAARWLEARDEGGPGVAQVYFSMFLANQDELVYEISHPDLHARIEQWMMTNEPECSQTRMPDDWVNFPDRTTLFCGCTVRVEGIETELDETIAPYYIVVDFDSLFGLYRTTIM